jgi:SAM-dependent methyltransferase
MPLARAFKARLLYPIIDRIADRIAHVLNERAALSPAKGSIQASIAGASGNDDALAARQPGTVENMSYARVIGVLPAPSDPPVAPRRRSELCKQADFALDAYRYWSSALGLPPTFHRKHWEFFYISQALYERGLLQPGRTGLGFGVGHELLPALFAARGCTIVATDQTPDSAAKAGWEKTNEHAHSLAALERPEICPSAVFREHVSFRVADMNHIPEEFADRFDFCWSACCLEHLGSLAHGIEFVENSLKTLKPGGVAVHTTEFNLSSNLDTIESRDLSIYRKRDIETMVKMIGRAGHQVEPLDLNTGTTVVDGYIDLPPYHEEPHLRLRILQCDCTSIGLIITRGR